MLQSTTHLPKEDLAKYRLYFFVDIGLSNTEDYQEKIAFEALTDQGDSVIGKVTKVPKSSDRSGYREGETYQVPKRLMKLCIRVLKSL